MVEITYKELQNAVKTFNLIGLENKDNIKKKYLHLSKLYHPDMQNGDTKKFQEIAKDYKILITYVDNFKFRFTQEEFKNQYPFSNVEDGPWSLW